MKTSHLQSLSTRLPDLLNRSRRQQSRWKNPLTALLVESFSPSDSMLTAEWSALAERQSASPYLRPEWVAAWWQAFGVGELRLLTVRRNRRLVGLMPVAWHRGCVRSLTNYHTPQSGLLADDAGVAYSLAQKLFAGNPRRVSLAGMPPLGGGLNACRRAALEAGYRIWVHPYQTSPYLSIEGNWAEYEARHGERPRDGLHRKLRRLGRRGQVSLDIVRGGERLTAALQKAFAIEALGWKGARGTAIRSRPETMGFYTAIARWMAARGKLRLFFLCLNGEPMAVLYALVENSVCHLLKSGYDPGYRQFSPGSLLMRSVVEHCCATGLRRVEFHGDADPYKLCWTSEAHKLKRFDAFSASLAGRLSLIAQVRARRAIKYLLGSIGWRQDTHEHRRFES